jgi:hypothetical protein
LRGGLAALSGRLHPSDFLQEKEIKKKRKDESVSLPSLCACAEHLRARSRKFNVWFTFSASASDFPPSGPISFSEKRKEKRFFELSNPQKNKRDVLPKLRCCRVVFTFSASAMYFAPSVPILFPANTS